MFRLILRYKLLSATLFLCIFLLFSFIYLSSGYVICGGRTELASLDFVKYYAGPGTAWELIEIMADMRPTDDCCGICQIEALNGICDRHPEEKEELVEYVVNEILEEDKSYFNRVNLILTLEALTGESFEPSGFPIAGWGPDEWAPVARLMYEARRDGVSPASEKFEKDIAKGLSYLRRQEMLQGLSTGSKEIPEEEIPNIERGLQYIRDWWEKRKAGKKEPE